MRQQTTLAGSIAQDAPALKSRFPNKGQPIETKRIPGLSKLAEKIVLKDQEVIGVFKKMGLDADGRFICFQSKNDFFFICFTEGTKEEKILRNAFRCVKPGCRIRIKKNESLEKSIDIKKIPNFRADYTFAKSLNVPVEEKIIGYYLELQHDFDEDHLIIKLMNSQIVKVSFPKTSAEAETVRLRLRSVRHKVKISIQRTNDPGNPIIVDRIPDLSSKQNAPHQSRQMLDQLEPFADPNISNPKKRILNAITTAIEVARNRGVIIAIVANQKIAQCNQIQRIEKADQVYCSLRGAPVSTTFCEKSCIVGKESLKLQGRQS